jgi:hypothetical protein
MNVAIFVIDVALLASGAALLLFVAAMVTYVAVTSCYDDPSTRGWATAGVVSTLAGVTWLVVSMINHDPNNVLAVLLLILGIVVAHVAARNSNEHALELFVTPTKDTSE